MTAVVAIVASYLALAILTGVGSRRRGDSRAVAALNSAVFPLAWIAWYVKDVLLHDRTDRPTIRGAGS